MMNDKYKKIKQIGQGGNGVVYEVVDASGNRFAMKVLEKIKFGKPYIRFKSEVEVLIKLKSHNGIIQIIDHYLPKTVSVNSLPFYVMPIGVKLSDFLKDKSDEEFYNLIFDLGKTLENLHTIGITHRDIKPDNILVVNNLPVFSDFGLANFPKKKKVSEPKEKIGPKWTIAPEMERISSMAEFQKADVYSFAKTLWMLITKQWWGFEGQYIPNSSISIDNYVDLMINKQSLGGKWYYHSIVLLNQLLVDATDNNPLNRPNAKSFNQRIKYWYDSCDDYFERNPYEWIDALKRLFPISIANTSSWSKIDDILNVLNIISTQYDNLNHIFYPNGGGDDLVSIEMSKEKGCFLLNGWKIIKPKILIFEFLDDYDWSYFRLELEPLKPFLPIPHSELIEYLSYDDFDNYTVRDITSSRPVSRFLKGSIVIVKKTSIINKLKGPLNAYSGYHNELTNIEYKELLNKVQSTLNEKTT